MSRLIVTPAELRAEANRIQSNTPLYANAYNNIYRDVDSLREAGWWRGQANDSFATQIQQFRSDFVALERLLADDFGRVLEASGTDYQNTEDTLTSEARRLPTSSM